MAIRIENLQDSLSFSCAVQVPNTLIRNGKLRDIPRESDNLEEWKFCGGWG